MAFDVLLPPNYMRVLVVAANPEITFVEANRALGKHYVARAAFRAAIEYGPIPREEFEPSPAALALVGTP
jgi:hypothetical protein